MHRRNSLATHTQHFARLCAWLNRDTCTAVDRRHLYFSAEHCRREVEHQVVSNVVLIAHKLRMLFLADLDKKVACHSATTRGIAFSAHAQRHAVCHTCRNVDRNDFLLALHAFAMTMRTLL